jgi:dTDP-4-amino-4,6-dideoxygalactose transaminase
MNTRNRQALFTNVPDSNLARVPFVESKFPNMSFITELFEQCVESNLWANRGPLYRRLAADYEAHMNVSNKLAITPCSNGGIGLEAIAKFLELKAGKPIRWVASSFSFSNLGRGYFEDTQFIDCNASGMLDLELLNALASEDFDGIIVTNVFGVWPNFKPYEEFAKKSGKYMIIDNAAGLAQRLPDWPYQSFSLHHTKPYGLGEGGLILSPKDEAESIYSLLNYGVLNDTEKHYWINNGKTSDVACAFQIDRLVQYPDWHPKYVEQMERIINLAAMVGLRPLFPFSRNTPATSLPFVAPKPISLENIEKTTHLTMSKYYLPISATPKCQDIFERLVNIPSHPDVQKLPDDNILDDFSVFMQD